MQDKMLNICVFVLLQLMCFTRSEFTKEYCQQQCVSVDNCIGFRNLPVADQQKLLTNYLCTNAQSTYFSIPMNSGQSICCPNSNVWTLLNSNGQNNMNPPLFNPPNVFGNQQPPVENTNVLNPQSPIATSYSNTNIPMNPNLITPSTNSSGSNQEDGAVDDEEIEGNKYPNNNRRNNIDRRRPIQRPSTQTSNFPRAGYNYPRRNDFQNIASYPSNNFQNMYPNSNLNYPNKNYPNNNFNYPNNQYNNENNRLGNNSPYGNQNIAPTPNLIGRCDVSTLNQIPPTPNSGCCGRDASDKYFKPPVGVLGQPNRRTSPDYNQNFWAPRNNPPQWNNNMYQPRVPNVFSPRYKRDGNAIATSKVNITFDNRITGGIPTELEDFPWTVLLLTTFDYGTKKTSFNCGGSLISNKFILTAAHCVSEQGARVSELEIYLAEYDKSTFPVDCKNGMDGRKCVENIVMQAEDIIPHPEYDENRLQNDIALIKLRGTAPYTDFIRPICLPPFNIDSPDLNSLRLFVAGWGRNGNYTSKIKQSTVINLVPQSECKRFYTHLTPRHLCAAGYSGEDTCKGDSGGPLMMLYEGQYFLTGIVSGKRADFPCGTAVPSLYTNVYNYLDWVKQLFV